MDVVTRVSVYREHPLCDQVLRFLRFGLKLSARFSCTVLRSDRMGKKKKPKQRLLNQFQKLCTDTEYPSSIELRDARLKLVRGVQLWAEGKKTVSACAFTRAD